MEKKSNSHTLINCSGGSKLEYAVSGRGAPLVFLHGGTVRYNCYMELLNELAKDFTVYAVNLPGHGRSAFLPDMNSIGQQLSEFIADKGLENVTVLGHSFGGGCGIYLAKYSDRLDKVILVDPLGVSARGSQISTIFRFLGKHIYGMMYSREIAKFYLLGLKDVCANVWILKTRIIDTFRLLIGAMYDDVKSFGPKSGKVNILWGRQDSILPVGNAQVIVDRIVGSQQRIVPGPHDWLMADKHVSTALVREIVGG